MDGGNITHYSSFSSDETKYFDADHSFDSGVFDAVTSTPVSRNVRSRGQAKKHDHRVICRREISDNFVIATITLVFNVIWLIFHPLKFLNAGLNVSLMR